jgi:hypothetical protein
VAFYIILYIDYHSGTDREHINELFFLKKVNYFKAVGSVTFLLLRVDVEPGKFKLMNSVLSSMPFFFGKKRF